MTPATHHHAGIVTARSRRLAAQVCSLPAGRSLFGFARPARKVARVCNLRSESNGKLQIPFTLQRGLDAAASPSATRARSPRRTPAQPGLDRTGEPRQKSLLYGLFATICGAGLLTSSWALTFWIWDACSSRRAVSCATVA